MKTRTYIYIAIAVFIILVLAAGFVTVQLNPSLLTTNFYEFIDRYFTQWSPALGAAGTFIAAMIAVAAIAESRRRQKDVIIDQNLTKIEYWVQEDLEFWTKGLDYINEYRNEARYENNLRMEKVELEKYLEEKKCEQTSESDKEAKAPSLREVREKLIRIDENLISANENRMKIIKKRIDNITEKHGSMKYRAMVAMSIVEKLNEPDLKRLIVEYQKTSIEANNEYSKAAKLTIENLNRHDHKRLIDDHTNDYWDKYALKEQELENNLYDIINCVISIRHNIIYHS